jgi:dihydroneopterin aldolase
VERATVKVRKETPVLDGIVDAVGVQMTRERDGRTA